MNEYDTLDVAKADAMKRALRTLAQGIGATVLVAVVAVLTVAFGDGVQWTVEYWQGLGALVGSSALTAAIAYLHRRFGADPTVL